MIHGAFHFRVGDGHIFRAISRGTARRQAPIVRGNDWSNVAPEDDRLRIAVTRILRIRLAGLTEQLGVEEEGAGH